MTFKVWPFSKPADMLPHEERDLIMMRTLALLPKPPEPEDD